MQDFSGLSAPLPLISVVMATYDGERFLRKQLDSIIAQTYPNLEIVVVDDASQDDTLAILHEYKAIYPKVQIFESQQNLGYIKNFERGLQLCNGDFVALSDQDDIWLPEKLSVLFREISNHDLAYCNSELIDADDNSLGIKLSAIKNHQSFWTPLNFVVGSSASGHAMLMRKAVIEKGLPLPTCMSHDYWLGYIGTLARPMKYVDEVLVLYRQHDTNAIGIPGSGVKTGTKPKPSVDTTQQLARLRVRELYEKCPTELAEKQLYYSILESYQDFSLGNNLKRMWIFTKFRREITAYKRRSSLRRWLFGLKMFAKIL